MRFTMWIILEWMQNGKILRPIDIAQMGFHGSFSPVRHAEKGHTGSVGKGPGQGQDRGLT